MVDMMAAGQMNGLFCQGLNILLAAPDKAKVQRGLAKLKWLVVIDPLETETAHFWENHGEFHNADPKAIQTEVIQLPANGLRRGRGHLHQLQPRHPVALEGGRRTGRVAQRHRDRGRALQPAERALRQGRRRLPGSDRQHDLELRQPGKSRSVRIS